MLMKGFCLLVLLVPCAAQAQQRPIWLMPTASVSTYSGPGASNWLSGVGLSINFARDHKWILHQVSITGREEVTFPFCLSWGCYYIPNRLNTFGYSPGIGRSSRYYIAGVFAGPTLIWGNGRVTGKENDNWPFSKIRLSLRMHAQAHVMPLRFLGLGAHIHYLPVDRIFGWGIALVVRIHQIIGPTCSKEHQIKCV